MNGCLTPSQLNDSTTSVVKENDILNQTNFYIPPSPPSQMSPASSQSSGDIASYKYPPKSQIAGRGKGIMPAATLQTARNVEKTNKSDSPIVASASQVENFSGADEFRLQKGEVIYQFAKSELQKWQKEKEIYEQKILEQKQLLSSKTIVVNEHNLKEEKERLKKQVRLVIVK